MNTYSRMSSIPYNRETRRKEVAIILAVFMGWMGAHKFYLGKWGAGVAYAVLAFSMIPLFLSAIDIIRLAMMDKTEFDWKYNTIPFMTPRKEDVSRREEKRKGDWKVERTRKYFDEGVKRARGKYVDNAEYKQGIKLFTDYLYRQALEQFELALKAFPNHPEILFQMACCNALLEQKEELFANLGKAVEYGLSNVERIRTTEALSYLRIQQEYDRIEISGFKDWRLMDNDEEDVAISDGQSSIVEEKVEEVKEPLSTDDLLVELKKLGEMRQKGIITEEEFAKEKHKLFA
jgi:TM2 domain-containing membrane protein YozV